MKGRRRRAAPNVVDEMVRAAFDGDTESIDRLPGAGADLLTTAMKHARAGRR